VEEFGNYRISMGLKKRKKKKKHTEDERKDLKTKHWDSILPANVLEVRGTWKATNKCQF
jgi:hypothetical protein